MSNRPFPKIAVTPPAFCQSKALQTELLLNFPVSRFNLSGSYFTEQELIEFLRDCDGVIIGRDPVTENVIQELSSLKFISKYGVGLDNVDTTILKENNIALGWTPGVNKLSVAELTLGFMLGLCHNIFQVGIPLKSGQWIKEGGSQLSGKTVGIIGCGNVGREVVRLLKPFGCRVLVRDIIDVSGFCQENGAEVCGVDDLVVQSDIISLHVPMTHKTKKLINKEFVKRMKSSSFLINTSRGGVVDQIALKQALIQSAISGAALDVFENEPPEDEVLLSLPNVMVTPHIGGNAKEAVEAMGRTAIEHLKKFFKIKRGYFNKHAG